MPLLGPTTVSRWGDVICIRPSRLPCLLVPPTSRRVWQGACRWVRGGLLSSGALCRCCSFVDMTHPSSMQVLVQLFDVAC